MEKMEAEAVVRNNARARAIIRFLNGEGPIDGCWFGDQHPAYKGAFWWRKYLPELEAALDVRAILSAREGD